MKRKANDEGSQGQAKKRSIHPLRAAESPRDSADDSFEDSASQLGSDASSTYRDGANPTPDTALTTTSTGSARRKFPSEYKTLKCTIAGCDKSFNRPARLAAHIRSHNQDRPFICTYEDCDKAYTEAKHLKQHIISTHTQERQYVCQEPGCGRGFTTGTKLRRHALVHEGKERYRCRGYEGCNVTFRKHNTLQRHIRTEHLGQKAFLCIREGCGCSYDTANALKRHTDREHGEVRFWCDECTEAAANAPDGESREPVGFTTQVLLEAHIRHEHVNCIFCEVKFAGQYELDKHMEIYHSGLTIEDRKTVECTFEGCEKKFTKRSNMKAHHKTAHEGIRFICGQVDTWESTGLELWNWTEEGCGQAFFSKLKCEEHALHVHLGRPRPKTESTTYVRKGGNVNFLDEISGVSERRRRQVPCTVPGCNARFLRNKELDKHMQAEHPNPAPLPRQGLELPAVYGGDLMPLPDGVVDDDAAGGQEYYLSAIQAEAENDAKDLQKLLDFDDPTALDPYLGHVRESLSI